jgi:hypothetical protein
MLDKTSAHVATRMPRAPQSLASMGIASGRRSTSRSWLAMEAAEVGRRSLVFVVLVGGLFGVMVSLLHL